MYQIASWIEIDLKSLYIEFKFLNNICYFNSDLKFNTESFTPAWRISII